MTSPHVLLADDTPAVLKLLHTSLANAGYRVTAVTSGDAADDALAAAVEPFAAAVLDSQMPGMCGAKVVAAARGRGDRTPVLIVTGYSAPEGLPTDDLSVGVLLKPFRLTELLVAIAVLRGQSPDAVPALAGE